VRAEGAASTQSVNESRAVLAGIALAALALFACRREPAPVVTANDAQDSPPSVSTASSGATSRRAASRPPPAAPAAAPVLPANAFPKPDRRVASIISPAWDDEDARDRAGEADTVMSLLGIGPGSTVADIGAGSGYYTVRAAARVGPRGRVYAEDIVANYVRDLRVRIAKAGLTNVETVLGLAHDPRLPVASVDRALLVHMYHEIEQPYALMYNLFPALRSGSRVGVVDVDRPTGSHGTPPALLKCEMAAAGYNQVAFHPLAVGYLAVFTAMKQSSPDDVRRATARPEFRERRC